MDALLPEELQARVLELLPPNDRALSGRFVSKSAWRHLIQQCTARLSLPMPRHALHADWQAFLQHALKPFSFIDKLKMLSVAASSGSEANLELAWGLLRPCLFPELLFEPAFYRGGSRDIDAGAAAVRSGHPHLLPWLLRHQCPLDPLTTLEAVAGHCDLQRLQQAWEEVKGDSIDSRGWDEQLALAAGRSAMAPTAKLSWLLGVVDPSNLQPVLASAAEGAAASGSQAVLQWLLEQGLDLAGEPEPSQLMRPWCSVLAAALQHGHVAVADWLVDKAGGRLPKDEEWDLVMRVWTGAVGDPSGAAVRWLKHRGVPVHDEAAEYAAWSGQLGTVQFLHVECGLPLTPDVFAGAAGSRSVPTATWLPQAGCPMSPDAYRDAAREGDVDMVRWLATEAKCPWTDGTLDMVLERWPRGKDSGGGGLEQAARLLVDAGCPPKLKSYRLEVVALQGYHLPLLRYLHEELGVQYRPGTLAEAAGGGCEAVLEWLVGAGCVAGGGLDEDPYLKAARRDDAATLSCLHRLGVPWNASVLQRAVEKRVRLPVLRWLVEQGAPWDGEAVARAVREAGEVSGFGDAAAWLEARIAVAAQHAEQAAE